MPASWVPIRPPPNSGARAERGREVLDVKSQIQPARLLRMPKSAMNATSWLSTGALWIGRNRTRSISDAADERQRDRERRRRPSTAAPLDQLPGDEGREHRHLALREIEMVDRLVDHHHGERHAGIDRPGRQPRHHLLQEEFHRVGLAAAGAQLANRDRGRPARPDRTRRRRPHPSQADENRQSEIRLGIAALTGFPSI